jgi:hypothetical protein
MYKDMQKYGVDKFRFEILGTVEPGYLKKVEQGLIEVFQPTYNQMNAKGKNIEKFKKCQKKYQQSDKGKETNRKAHKKYRSQHCLYNDETLTLNALEMRFRRNGIKNPVLEAKKYLIK